MNRTKMYLRMITASFMRRRSRMIIALLAIAVGATILAGLVTIYRDVPRQMGAQFRNYGANMIFTPTGESFSAEDMENALKLVNEDEIVGATPFRYETVRMHEQPILAAGIDMESAKSTSPYWSLDGDWADETGEMIVGSSVAEALSLSVGDTVTVTYAAGEDSSDETGASAEGDDASGEDSSDETGASAESDADSGEETEEVVDTNSYMDFTVSAILSTGGSEEEYVYISMADMEELTGVSDTYDIAEISLSSASKDLSAYADEISESADSLTARLVKRVTASETTVLTKLQALVLLVTIVVLALTMICVATTMTAVVAERRQEIGLRKAIGASDSSIVREFLGEAIMLGIVGGIIGSVLGFLFAQVVSVNVFGSSIAFSPVIIPLTLAVSVAITAASCMLPIRSATKVDPALVLKGE